MRKRVLFFLFFLSHLVFTFAQSRFQGTLRYDFKMTGEGVEAFEAMLPTGFDVTVLKSDILTEIKGGMMALTMGRVLTQTSKNMSYVIKDSEETIYVIDPEKSKNTGIETEIPEIIKEEEIINIAGYPCRKYRIISTVAEGKSTVLIWVTDKLELPEINPALQAGTFSGMLYIKGIRGIPLKIMNSAGGMSVTMTANSVNTSAPDKRLFKLPKKYKREVFDAESAGQGMFN